MTITLPSELGNRLTRVAEICGLDPTEYARTLIESALSSSESNLPLIELFARWDAEDYTDDPAETARREEECKEFMRAMNRNRRESDGPNARIPYPDVT